MTILDLPPRGGDTLELRWARVAEAIRAEPRLLALLRRDHPDLYKGVLAGLHALAIRASDEEWRDPAPDKGARPEQLLPGTPGSFSDRTDWLLWLLCGGRGSGKSRTGAEGTKEQILGRTWTDRAVWALVGQTLDAVRVNMVENTLMQVLPPGSIHRWNRGVVELTLSNGAFLKGFSSAAPRKILGYNFHGAWVDELATLDDADRSPSAMHTTWSNLVLAMRGHDNHTWKPRIIGTTTPKAVRLLRNLDPNDPENPGPGIYDAPTTVVSRMSTLDNIHNLPEHFILAAVKPYEGTRLYAQEVEGELLDLAVGAQWSAELIAQMKGTAGLVYSPHYCEAQAGGYRRIVIGVDPSVGEGIGSECGIVVAGLCQDGRGYILADLSKRCPPREWARLVSLAAKAWNADSVVAEVNHGYELVTAVLNQYDPSLPVRKVVGKRSKMLRAEPVALLSDQDRLRIAAEDGAPKLCFQMTTWEGDPKQDSPDRLDAMVYAALDLLRPANIGDLVTFLRSGAGRV